MNDAIFQGRNQSNSREFSNRLTLNNGVISQSFSNQTNAVDRLQDLAASLSNDETLVDDSRAELSPAQMVEHKLVRILRGNPMPVRFLLSKRGR
jgi:hypothetical protein